jgi:dolichyl-phosphate-mannose--protein O-mannosyl transferase
MALDPIHIMFSRQSVQEVYMPFFLLVGFYLTFRYLETRKPTVLFFAGIFFGLGLASKWMGLAIQLFLILVLLVYRYSKEGEQDTGHRLSELLLYFATLIVLPATIYFLSYAPWFLYRGYDISEWLTLQKVSSLENLTHKGANSFIQVQDHVAALWFLRPIGYADFMMSGHNPIIVLALSNPFIWLLTLPATVYLLCHIKKLDWQQLFLLALFWCSYLPLALSRRVTAANSSFGVLPFAFMLSACFLVKLSNGRPKGSRYLYLYLSIAIAAAIPLYFMTIGKGFGDLFQPILNLYRPLNER